MLPFYVVIRINNEGNKYGVTMYKITVEEFDNIVNNYYQKLFNVAYGYTKDSLSSEDVVIEVFNKLYMMRNMFTSEEHLKNWLYRVTINRAIDVSRKKKKEIVNEEIIDLVKDESSTQEDNMYNLVMKLKENYKKVIILYYYENMSIKEISDILKVSEDNVKMRLSRARTRLKELIEEEKKNGK